MPPCRSASVTTPTGSEVQARTRDFRSRPCRRPAPARRAPTSRRRCRTARRPRPADRPARAQPATARCASVSRSTISRSSSVSSRTRRDELAAVLGGPAGFRGDQPRPGDAARLHLGAADLQRLDGPRRSPRRSSRRDPPRPSPSRTMREKASTTRNPSDGGPGDEQAAIVGAEVERGIGPRPAAPMATGRQTRSGEEAGNADGGEMRRRRADSRRATPSRNPQARSGLRRLDPLQATPSSLTIDQTEL